MKSLKNHTSGRRRWLLEYSAFLWLLTGTGLVQAAGSPSEGLALTENACTNTAITSLKACRAGVRDDYFTNFGDCINHFDQTEVEQCILDVSILWFEDRAACVEQKDARLEICEVLGGDPYDPVIDPAQFLDVADIVANPHPFYPLIPGMVKVYQEGEETITVTVTDQTKIIQGVTCLVVRDVVDIDGELVEDTDDWLAQDINGNVWYFGENSRNYEGGELTDLDGSWKAGVDGARAGILMPAMPEVGHLYRQEFAIQEAEDMGAIISLTEFDEAVPAADCSAGCVVTRDFTPLEPEVKENKFYAPGIGHILSVNLEDGVRNELIEITIP